jgi:DNA polymerase (family 10)
MEIHAEGGVEALTAIPGIGKSIAAKIEEVLQTGALGKLEEVSEEVPPELRELLNLPGLGPKGVRRLQQELGVRDLEGLEKACREGKVRALKGFGEKTEGKILEGIASFRQRRGRFRLDVAESYAESLRERIRAVPGVGRVEAAGSYRRRKETVGDLDLLVTAADAAPVMEALVSHPAVEKVLARGETKTSVELENGMQVDLRLVEPDAYGAALLYFTGSKEHNIQLRTEAKAAGFKTSEYGLFRGEERVAGRTEEEVYAALGMGWIPPELRERQGEIEAARAGTLPRLVERADVLGDCQMHTTRSDGADTPQGMARAARALGYQYIAITEHSKAVTVAHGLDEEELVAWCGELEKADREVERIRILKGIEVDILKDGRLDLDEEVLRSLDVVVATVHSHMEMPEREMTERVLRALRSGVVTVLGHPTGRLLTAREPFALDVEAVLRECARLGVAVELNAHPARLDLKDVHLRLAKQIGAKVVISTDAHSAAELSAMRFGAGMARRGWLEKGDVLNTLPLDAFLAAVRRPGGGAPAARGRGKGKG